MDRIFGAAVLVVFSIASGLTAVQKDAIIPSPLVPSVEYSNGCNGGQVPCSLVCIFTQINKTQDTHWAYTDESKVTKLVNSSEYDVAVLPKMGVSVEQSLMPPVNDVVSIRTTLFFNTTKPEAGHYTCLSRDPKVLNGITHTFEVSSPEVMQPPGMSDMFCNETEPCEKIQDYRYKCMNNTCQCIGYAYLYVCLPQAYYGQFCIYDGQCQMTDPNLLCSSYYSRCDCVYGYDYDSSDMVCEYDYWTNYLSWSATTAIVVSVVLLVVIICVFCMIYIRTSSHKRRRTPAPADDQNANADRNSECTVSSEPDCPPTYEQIGMSRMERSETPPPSFDDIVKSPQLFGMSEFVDQPDTTSGFQVVQLEGVTVTEGHTNPAYDGEC